MDPNWKLILTELLVELGFLDERTETIVLNCSHGKVVDVKPTQRYK